MCNMNITNVANSDDIIRMDRISATPDSRGLYNGIGGNYWKLNEILYELTDNAIADYLSQENRDKVCRIDVVLDHCGDHVEVSVRDRGSGIADLGAALTIGAAAPGKCPLHEHAMGIKHALASVSTADDQDWCIRTRTANDAAEDCYREVHSPYSINDMMCVRRKGGDKLFDGTGTIVRFRCPLSLFETLKPKNRRMEPTFEEYLGFVVEGLRYVYAPMFAEGWLSVRVEGSARDYHGILTADTPLEPTWVPGSCRTLPDIETDLGGGTIKMRIRHGRIIPNKSTGMCYKGNMSTSGFEIRLNGRLIERGLYEETFGEKLHPSQNLFLAQVDLEYDEAGKAPPTKTAKNGFRRGTPQLDALFRALRMYVEKPGKDVESQERKLVTKLKEKMEADSGVIRATMEEGAYETLGLGTCVDLYVSRVDGAVIIYEAKAGGSKAENLYQLMMYWDGCLRDGKPVREAVLIAARHPKEVEALSEELRLHTDQAGNRYNIRLTTWVEEGVSLARQAA